MDDRKYSEIDRTEQIRNDLKKRGGISFDENGKAMLEEIKQDLDSHAPVHDDRTIGFKVKPVLELSNKEIKFLRSLNQRYGYLCKIEDNGKNILKMFDSKGDFVEDIPLQKDYERLFGKVKDHIGYKCLWVKNRVRLQMIGDLHGQL